MATATAQRMLDTLPGYEQDEPFFARIVQAWADEVDRLDALIDKLETESQPGGATDDLGLLAVWETILGLPAGPVGVPVDQRRAKVTGALRGRDASTAANVLATLSAAVAGDAVVVLRDTPAVLQDTLVVPYLAGTYNAAVVETIARRVWPAHRGLLVHYSDGFVLDRSRLDVDSF
jgi:uncharacterized protein YmfQ (DUF2313 family)